MSIAAESSLLLLFFIFVTVINQGIVRLLCGCLLCVWVCGCPCVCACYEPLSLTSKHYTGNIAIPVLKIIF